MADQKYVVNALEDLIEVAGDGRDGYIETAEHAKDPRLGRFLDSVWSSLNAPSLQETWRAMQCNWVKRTLTAPEARRARFTVAGPT